MNNEQKIRYLLGVLRNKLTLTADHFYLMKGLRHADDSELIDDFILIAQMSDADNIDDNFVEHLINEGWIDVKKLQC